jgi:hypothetical protein
MTGGGPNLAPGDGKKEAVPKLGWFWNSFTIL